MIREVLYYFEGLDESILKLNKYLVDSDFKFIKLSIGNFVKQFKDILKIPENDYWPDEIVPPLKVPMSLIPAIENIKYFNHHELINNPDVIFLKDLQRSSNEDIDELNYNIEKLKTLGHVQTEDEGRLNELIKKLKLLKSGHVKLLSSFEFQGSLCIPESYSSPSRNNSDQKYFIDNNDLSSEGLKYFKEELLIPDYLKLAFNSFLEYYNVEDSNIKFVMLMIALESIFNMTGDQITHTISRHVAILLTIKKDKENIEALFKENIRT